MTYLPINSTGYILDVKVQCIKSSGMSQKNECRNCCLFLRPSEYCNEAACYPSARKDNEDVIFKYSNQ